MLALLRSNFNTDNAHFANAFGFFFLLAFKVKQVSDENIPFLIDICGVMYHTTVCGASAPQRIIRLTNVNLMRN